MATLTSISLNVNQNPIIKNASTGFSVTATYSDNTTKDVTDMCTYTFNNEIIDLKTTYLTFTALESGTFSFSQNNLQYSLNDGVTWTTLATDTSTPTVTAGNKIMWKQTGLTPNSSYGMGTFSSTGNFNVSGNIMSLYYGDDFLNQTSLSGKDYAFYRLFRNCTKLISAENLALPATTLANYCYGSMFYGCTSLTKVPLVLPATTLTDDCYDWMFVNCTSLTSVPSDYLPATTLTYYCYAGMFMGCTSLTAVPNLPATICASGCYASMFNGCASLTTVPSNYLPATTLADYCYASMFYGCNLTTAPDLIARTMVERCYDSMFYGCSNLNYIKCYGENINDPAFTTSYWLYNVASTGTFVKKEYIYWSTGFTGIPDGWTTEDFVPYNPGEEYLTFTAIQSGTFSFTKESYVYINLKYSLDNGNTWTVLESNVSTPTVSAGNKILWKSATQYNQNIGNYGMGKFSSTGNFNVSGNIMSLYYSDDFADRTSLSNKAGAFRSLFSGCKIVSAENLALPATTLANRCYYYMFGRCTSLTTAPELLATTLVDESYRSMFYYCSSLTYIKCLATDISATNCTTDWVLGVSSTGTFIKDSNMTSWTTGDSGIHTGWTVQNV